MTGDEQEAAEEYRRQRQNAAARKHGVKPVGREAYDRELVLEVARRAGATGHEIEAVADFYLKILSEQPQGSDFDSPDAILILSGLIHRVEMANAQLKLPTRGGVVFGNAPGTGLIASQMPVLQTELSIIEVTLPFLIFCNLVSKALAHTIPDPVAHPTGTTLTFDLEQIKHRLIADPWVSAHWMRILLAYAVMGEPPSGPGRTPEGPRSDVHGILLDAMEIFAVAHEYGHHCLMHGIAASSAEPDSSFQLETDADLLARLISGAIGKDEDQDFIYSGAGGALMLGAIDLVARARSVLVSGSDILPPSKTHPPVAERIKRMDEADRQHLPYEIAERCVRSRQRILETLNLIWDHVRPTFELCHKEEPLKPEDETKGPSDWLPLGSNR
jgi:hypothetical protein